VGSTFWFVQQTLIYFGISTHALLQSKSRGFDPRPIITTMASDNLNKVLGTLPEDIEKADKKKCIKRGILRHLHDMKMKL